VHPYLVVTSGLSCRRRNDGQRRLGNARRGRGQESLDDLGSRSYKQPKILQQGSPSWPSTRAVQGSPGDILA
jgi:hypothetical protein